ncbi:hypothetical protein ACQPZX_30120 [Actinoplanes sp. CA-142083]|uniref:hypothetical protein n=1 Tax=Actinoplanes sp. CA-142083 TaxID=3239903 RepID=UPI003D9304ED
MRKWAPPVAVMLGIALVVGTTPATAQAAGLGQIIISNDWDTNAGVVHVSVESTEPVASIHADFVDEATGATGGAADNFVLEYETSTSVSYVTSSPVVMDPGAYQAQVTVTADDGTVAAASERLIYYVNATVEDLTADRPAIDWDHRDVTVSGVLRGRWPGTGEVRPLAGALVNYWVYMNAGDPVVTDANGAFSRTFTMAGTLNTMDFFYDSGSPYTRGTGITSYTVTVTPQQTRVRVRADKRHAKVGDPITLTGKVERLGAHGWAPAPPQTGLWIETCDDTGCAYGYNNVEIAADGTFRSETTAQRTGYFQVSVTGYLDFFAGSTGRTAVVKVR